jgi:hypothetical protein
MIPPQAAPSRRSPDEDHGNNRMDRRPCDPGRIERTDGEPLARGVRMRAELVSMASKQGILGLVYSRSEIRRSPLVGMEFLHQGAVSPADLTVRRPRLQAKDLISLLFRHFPGRRTADVTTLPPCPFVMRVLTPSGKPAIKITFQKRQALGIEGAPHRDQRLKVEVI